MRVLFLGSSHIGGICLDFLIENEINVIGVVSVINKKPLSIKSKIKKIFKFPFFVAIDKLRNLVFKSSPSFDFLNKYYLKNIAENRKIKLYDVDILNNLEKLQELNPDLIIVASFGKLLSTEILNLPKLGCLNLHPSYLPEYRGGCPAYSLIKNNELFGGVTIHKMNEKFDEGDIVYQEKIELKNLNSVEYEIEVANTGKKLLLQSIHDIQNQSINCKKQDINAKMTCYHNNQISCLINWNSKVENIVAQVKACCHPNTNGAYSYNFFTKVFVIEASEYSFNKSYSVGKLCKIIDDGLVFQAGDGEILISKIFLNGQCYKNQELKNLNIKRLTQWHLF